MPTAPEVPTAPTTPRHRCAVWGSPVEHSLSPVLHLAAYRALGLTDWAYERREVDEAGFASAFAALGEEWRGLSLTMPLKEVGATVARSLSRTARETGSVNTLVREPDGWSGHNTDVHGIVAALREAGLERATRAVVIGSGATARSAVAALGQGGTRSITFMVRAQPRPETVAQARRAGLDVDVVSMGEWPAADVVISTVPPASVPALDALPPAGGRVPVLLDVVYGEGRTALEEAAVRRGWITVDGTSMLLHQAALQVRLMTGLEAPVEAMRAALAEARPGSGS
ncbi:MAG TPA: shikimate dehydrogenase [Dermatophilaceae bacterium]|nr:shikimate dehydrogenase [Dermatophilaceae bacterium]